MNCRKVSRRLSAYIEGDLSPRETNGLEEHLKTCSLCRRKLSDIRLISQTATQLEQKIPGPYFNSRLMCAINSQKSSTLVLKSWRHKLTLSGAAFVLAACLTFLLINPQSSTVSVSTAGVNSQAEAPPRMDSNDRYKGFPVSGEALERDMALTGNPKADSIARDSIMLPKHYVQPVGIKKNNRDNVVF
jgi:anti-sigma factor RsiW